MRVSCLVLLLGTSVANGAAAAHAARAPSPAEATCRSLPGLNVLFRFGTGSPPVAQPVVGADGAAYVGTREGYLHALHPDGSYRWSYTLRGTVTGRPAISGSGVVLVPTPQRVYALRADGSLLWIFNSPVWLAGGLTRDAAGRFHFASNDGRVFALSGRGALLGHIPGRSRVSAPPLALADGSVAVGRADGSIVWSSKGHVERFKLEGAVTALLGCPGARVCAIAGGVLHGLGGEGPAFRTPATRAAQGGELLRVLVSDEQLEGFAGLDHERQFRVQLPEPASATPLLDPAGNTYVPLRSGALLTVSRQGELTGCVAVANSPLGAPVFDAPRRRVLVTASEGLLAAVALE